MQHQLKRFGQNKLYHYQAPKSVKFIIFSYFFNAMVTWVHMSASLTIVNLVVAVRLKPGESFFA